MGDQKVRDLKFRHVSYRATVQIHLRKANAAKPREVDKLTAVIRKIVNAGPALYGCHDLITTLTSVETSDGKRWFAVIPAASLLAIVRWDYRHFTVLAIIDLDRLARRRKQRPCIIVDCELDTDGRELPVALFIDSKNQVVCTIFDSNDENVRLYCYDPWGEQSRDSAIAAR